MFNLTHTAIQMTFRTKAHVVLGFQNLLWNCNTSEFAMELQDTGPLSITFIHIGVALRSHIETAGLLCYTFYRYLIGIWPSCQMFIVLNGTDCLNLENWDLGMQSDLLQGMDLVSENQYPTCQTSHYAISYYRRTNVWDE